MSDQTKERSLAVALQYEKGSRDAPKVVAKGSGIIAERIVALAQQNGVIIETNPVLAQALSGIEIDDTIPIELYEAVAIVIGYVLRTGTKT